MNRDLHRIAVTHAACVGVGIAQPHIVPRAGRGNTPKLRRIKPYGKQYIYSGGGITLAELAFIRITGTSLREAFQKEVAEPLGLKRTGYFQPLDEE